MYQKDDRLTWIYSSKNTGELAERYDRWAQSYDKELEDNKHGVRDGDRSCRGNCCDMLIKVVDE